MKALSIKQPWAWLICMGYKDVENRPWRIGRGSQHGPYRSYHQANFTVDLPERIYAHAPKQIDDTGWEFIRERLEPYSEPWDLLWQTDFIARLPLGAIVGEVDITECVTESVSKWFTGKYGFVLTNPIAYEKPIPCRGQLGFFDPLIAQNA